MYLVESDNKRGFPVPKQSEGFQGLRFQSVLRGKFVNQGLRKMVFGTHHDINYQYRDVAKRASTGPQIRERFVSRRVNHKQTWNFVLCGSILSGGVNKRVQ